MLSEDEKRRRLALLQQQNLTPFQKSMQQQPTAQQVSRQIFPAAIRNVPTNEPAPLVQAVKTVFPSYARLGRGFSEVLGEVTGVNQRARQAQLQSLQQGSEAIKTLQQRIASPTTTEAQRQRDRQLIGRIANIDLQTAQQMQNIAQQQIERANPAKGAAAVGLVGLDVLTLGSLTPGAKAALGISKLGPTAGRAAAIGGGALGGAAYGPLGVIQEKGMEATPTELIQSAGIGGAIGGAIPATLGVFGRLIRPVQRFLGRETAQQTEQRLAREAAAAREQAARRAASEVPSAPARPTTPATRTAPRVTAPVSDAVVNRIVTKKSTADIEKTIKNIYPNIDTPSFNVASNAIRSATNTQEVKQILDGLTEIKTAIDKNLPTQVVPTTGTQITAARLAEELQQSTGRTRITQAPEQPQTPLTYEGYTQKSIQAAEESKARYTPATIKRKLLEIWDPRQAPVRLDRAAKSAYKREGKQYTQADSLDLALSQSSQSTAVAQEFLKNSNIAKIVAKYGYDTPEAIRFNQYRILKRDIELVQDGRPAIDRTTSLEDKIRLAAEYERQNPQALSDLKTLSNEIKKVQDLTVSGPNAFIEKNQLVAARTKKDGSQYQFYTPLARALPEEVERAVITGQNLAGLGRQRVLQEMTGSDIPADISWDAITDYVETVYRQLGNARVQRILEQRVKEALIPGARFIQTGEQIGQIKTKKQELAATRQLIEAINKRVKITNKEVRKLASELNKLQKEGLKVKLGEKPKEPIKQQRKLINYKVVGEYIKNNAPKTIDDLKTSYTIKDLLLKRYGYGKIKQYTKAAKNEKEFAMQQFIADVYNGGREFVKQVAPDMKKSTFDNLVKQIYKKPTVIPGYVKVTEKVIGRAPSTQKVIESLIRTDSPTLVRIKNKVITREPKLAALVQDVINAKTQLEAAKSIKAGLKNEISVLTPDPTTGLQTIIGRDINGNTYRIELPPEYANVLQGFDKEQLAPLLKATRAAQEPFRQAWVGLLNPPFQISTSIWNAVMAPIISARGYRLYSPAAAKAAVNGFFNRGEMIDLIRKNGGVSFGGNLEKLTSDKTAQALAKSNDMVSKAKWYGELQNGRGFRRTWSKLNEYGGRIDQATRNAAATISYNQALKNGLTREQAIAEALKEWNNVLPDYANVSQLVKSIDAIIPFTAALAAGTRTFLRAFRERPIQTTAKLAAAGSAMSGVIYYNLSSEAGQKFYEDMKLAKKDYLLDNNLIIVLPGAKKDETTGEWSGIVKIHLAPELRSINKAIRETIYEVSSGRGVPVGTIALSAFDTLTGKLRDQSSPLYQTGVAISTGIDPRTGRQIYDETMDNAQKAEAIKEYIRRNLGLPGQMAGGNAYEEFFNGFIDRVYGAKGTTPGSRFFQNQNKSIQDVGLNPNELDAYYGTVSPRSKDLTGNLIKDKTYYDSASRATTWLRYPKTFEVSKKIDQLSRAQGNPGDPIFDLPPEQLRVVLNLQSTFSPGMYEDKAIRRLNPWLDEFNKKRSEYFDKVLSDEVKQKGAVDPMGVAIPQATPDMQKKLNTLSTLTTSADRAKFYADNPEITDFFSKQDAYERTKRGFLGLPQFDEYPTADKNTQSYLDEYNALPKGEGPLKRDGTPSSPTRSAWIRSNPNKWNAITNQWSKQDIYRIQKEGALAVYEGINFTEQGMKSIKDLAKSLGVSTQSAANTWANSTPAERQYLTDFLNQIQPPSLPKITGIKAKQIKQFKIKLPSTTRRGARIKLQ